MTGKQNSSDSRMDTASRLLDQEVRAESSFSERREFVSAESDSAKLSRTDEFLASLDVRFQRLESMYSHEAHSLRSSLRLFTNQLTDRFAVMERTLAGAGLRPDGSGVSQVAERLNHELTLFRKGTLPGPADPRFSPLSSNQRAKSESNAIDSRGIVGIETENKRLKAELKDRYQEIVVLTRMLQEIGNSSGCESTPLLPSNPSPPSPNVSGFISNWSLTKILRRQKSSKLKLSKAKNLVVDSGLFDADWYLQTQAPDLRGSDAAIEHYLSVGAKQKKDPNRSFSTSGYLRRYPDVAASGINPLIHYIKYGRSEGRSTGAD